MYVSPILADTLGSGQNIVSLLFCVWTNIHDVCFDMLPEKNLPPVCYVATLFVVALICLLSHFLSLQRLYLKCIKVTCIFLVFIRVHFLGFRYYFACLYRCI